MEQAHFSALEAKHSTLEHRIAEESRRPIPDTVTLAHLKKRKLRIKEELSEI
ncbi:YdcH family protein [Sphingobium boeckii]|uniref:DUF465 domain-containing protein n=1 Tax=Sphingobium boeckii TaxID=1082345 RepID=A0A7W9AGY4_9SPHN|nr:YdcH family protein [Sphingobium boeckii]MBB5685477.1 hypothetical protein [Sphingobium boeckii]